MNREIKKSRAVAASYPARKYLHSQLPDQSRLRLGYLHQRICRLHAEFMISRHRQNSTSRSDFPSHQTSSIPYSAVCHVSYENGPGSRQTLATGIRVSANERPLAPLLG